MFEALSPIETKKGTQRTQIAKIDLENFTLVNEFTPVGDCQYFYRYYGQNQTHVFVGGLNVDGPEKHGKLTLISIQDWKAETTIDVPSGKKISFHLLMLLGFFPKNNYFNLDTTIQETNDYIIFVDCSTDILSFTLVDKEFNRAIGNNFFKI
jgi:hypothetical protein